MTLRLIGQIFTPEALFNVFGPLNIRLIINGVKKFPLRKIRHLLLVFFVYLN